MVQDYLVILPTNEEDPNSEIFSSFLMSIPIFSFLFPLSMVAISLWVLQPPHAS